MGSCPGANRSFTCRDGGAEDTSNGKLLFPGQGLGFRHVAERFVTRASSSFTRPRADLPVRGDEREAAARTGAAGGGRTHTHVRHQLTSLRPARPLRHRVGARLPSPLFIVTFVAFICIYWGGIG